MNLNLNTLIATRDYLKYNVWKKGSSKRQCIITTCILHCLFDGNIVGGWQWGTRGGKVQYEWDEPIDGGYLFNGKWMGHYWLEKDSKIIDLTADQFGGPEIVFGNIKSLNQYRVTSKAITVKYDTDNILKYVKEYGIVDRLHSTLTETL